MLWLVLIAPCAWAQTCTGSGNLEIVEFKSDVFHNVRKLRVLLPEGYHRPGNALKYGVLYLNDGEQLFDACSTETPTWQADKAIRELVRSRRIKPLIVVGIDSSGRRTRANEYLPYPDDSLKPPIPAPQGKLYPDFLLKEVIPFVESKYRVKKGPADRLLGGASYGAGIAIYTAATRPDSFSGLLLESPSIYADDFHLLDDMSKTRKWPRTYVGVGTVKEPTDAFRILRAFFLQSGAALCANEQKDGEHSAAWWGQRFPTAIEFLAGTSHPCRISEPRVTPSV